MIVVGFDPGETTGWAGFETSNNGEEAKMIGYGQEKFSNLIDALENEKRIIPPDVVVIEIFQLLPHKAQKMIGQRFLTIEAQGIIRSWAKRHKAKIVEQRPTIKPIAEKWTHIIPPSNHSQSHWIDAVNHAKYWMIKNELDLTQLQKQNGEV